MTGVSAVRNVPTRHGRQDERQSRSTRPSPLHPGRPPAAPRPGDDRRRSDRPRPGSPRNDPRPPNTDREARRDPGARPRPGPSDRQRQDAQPDRDRERQGVGPMLGRAAPSATRIAQADARGPGGRGSNTKAMSSIAGLPVRSSRPPARSGARHAMHLGPARSAIPRTARAAGARADRIAPRPRARPAPDSADRQHGPATRAGRRERRAPSRPTGPNARPRPASRGSGRRPQAPVRSERPPHTRPTSPTATPTRPAAPAPIAPALGQRTPGPRAWRRTGGTAGPWR